MSTQKKISTRRTRRLLPPTTSPDQCVCTVDILQDPKVSFQAAPIKASNGAANLADASIYVAYLLSLHMMYTVTGDGGVMRKGRDVPVMLTTFGKEEKWVMSNNIMCIDWSKFKAMELVETLRYRKKYILLGAWAYVDLFLEEPLCTGEFRVGAYSFLGLPLEDNDTFLFRSSFRPRNSRRVIENSRVCG